MDYSSLPPAQKRHVNGVLAKFMDRYIRTHLIWTPEQMYQAFYDEMVSQHRAGWYGRQEYRDGRWVSLYREGSEWLTTSDALPYIMEKFTTKYEKNKKLARKKSPLIERARFGLRWDEGRFYDINWGLKEMGSFEKMDVVESWMAIPWSIAHVEEELAKKYAVTLRDVLQQLCRSPIERVFYEEWLGRYYEQRQNPALMPEFCGTRQLFYCYEDAEGRYALEQTPETRAINVRYDFGLVNYEKQKMLLLELDGQEYHKTKDQRLNDAVKRALATNNGWQLNVITGTQVNRDIDGVFRMMEDYFSRQ